MGLKITLFLENRTWKRKGREYPMHAVAKKNISKRTDFANSSFLLISGVFCNA